MPPNGRQSLSRALHLYLPPLGLGLGLLLIPQSEGMQRWCYTEDRGHTHDSTTRQTEVVRVLEPYLDPQLVPSSKQRKLVESSPAPWVKVSGTAHEHCSSRLSALLPFSTRTYPISPQYSPQELHTITVNQELYTITVNDPLSSSRD